MANPSPQAVEKIRARVGTWAVADAAILAGLNAPAVPNPVPEAPLLPRPFSVTEVFGRVSQASLARLLALPCLTDIRDKLQANDVAGCLLYADLLLAGGVLTQEDRDAVVAVVDATRPDPSWSALISWAEAEIGRPLDLEDIAASRPGA